MTRHIGGSLLPSGSPEVYRPKIGQHGTFETRPLHEIDTHGLFYSAPAGAVDHGPMLIAMHPNGYSCDELAKRIIAAWRGETPPERALDQFDFILACGGMGKSRSAIEHIASGEC